MSQQKLEPSEKADDDGVHYVSTGVAEACGCGALPGSSRARPEPRYGGWGIFSLLWGMSTPPKAIVYKCWTCDKVVGETEDPAALEAHGKP